MFCYKLTSIEPHVQQVLRTTLQVYLNECSEILRYLICNGSDDPDWEGEENGNSTG